VTAIILMVITAAVAVSMTVGHYVGRTRGRAEAIRFMLDEEKRQRAGLSMLFTAMTPRESHEEL